jgi:hypothetical protein
VLGSLQERRSRRRSVKGILEGGEEKKKKKKKKV